MGQNHSCKCNYDNDQKKNAELKFEKKVNDTTEIDNKSQKPFQETLEFKTKSSRAVNKTLEVNHTLLSKLSIQMNVLIQILIS
jgi:hypothetical protein